MARILPGGLLVKSNGEQLQLTEQSQYTLTIRGEDGTPSRKTVTLENIMTKNEGIIHFRADGRMYTATLGGALTLSSSQINGEVVDVDFDSIDSGGDVAMSISDAESSLEGLHLVDSSRSPSPVLDSPWSPIDKRPSKKTRLGGKRRSARRAKKNKQKHTKRHRRASKSRAHHHHHHRTR